MKRLIMLVFLAAASPAWAQRIELTPLASYTTPADIDHAENVADLQIDRGFAWGGQATYFVGEHVGLEVLWTYQSTALSMSTTSVTAELFEMTTNQLLGNVVYQFGSAGASIRPFVFGGAGATFLDAPDLASETKPSWTAGGGLKWFLGQRVGAKVQARYRPTALGDSSSDYCDPFGFCEGALNHFEVAAGAVFRF